ncbi:hypothetical protein GF402_07560 [Candidatus Fermentibacteria bacterium]|nr:hypothetical protein [Candidatus Fermentibacteria bacterium]
MALRSSVWFVFVAALMLAFASCGGGEEPSEQPEEGPAEQEEGAVETEEPSEEASPGEGDSVTNAIQVSPGTIEGEIEDSEDENWYVFDVEGGETFDIAFTPGGDTENINVQVLNAEQRELWTEWDVPPTVTEELNYMTSSDSGGDFYLHVWPGSPGSYSIELSKRMQDDGGTGADAGGRAPEAAEVALGDTIQGAVGDIDESDWYVFEVPSGDLLEVEFTPGNDAENINVQVLDPEQRELWTEWDVAPGVTKTETFAMSCSSGGPYYVQAWQGSKGSYALEVSASAQDDAGVGTDAGDRAVDAAAVQPGEELSGFLGDFDEDDWYSVELAEGENLSFSFTPGEDCDRMNVQVCDPDQREMQTEFDVASGVTTELTLPQDVPAGTYYLHVWLGEKGGYSFQGEEI